MTTQFGYQCEYCRGTVCAKRVEREAFKHKVGFVILERSSLGSATPVAIVTTPQRP